MGFLSGSGLPPPSVEPAGGPAMITRPSLLSCQSATTSHGQEWYWIGLITGKFQAMISVPEDRGTPAAPQTPPAGRATARPRARGEFADLLRSRRDRLTPADVGLPEGSRRRTAGLRREEVAQLAGV